MTRSLSGHCLRFGLTVIFAICGPALLLPCIAQENGTSVQNYAFLFGVSKYQHTEMNSPKLLYPEADAAALGKVLEESGYRVKLILGDKATQQSIRDELAKLDRISDSDGVVVLGFFGHGIESEKSKEAFFCPYDTSLHQAKSLDDDRPAFTANGAPLLEPDPASLISMADIMLELRKCPAGNKILLADCCRSEPNPARGRAFGTKLDVLDLPDNTAVIMACSSLEKAYEHDDWKHGAFTKCLLDEIELLRSTGNLNIANLAFRVKENVSRLVSAKFSGRTTQTPYILLHGTPSLGSELGRKRYRWNPREVEIFIDRWGANRTEALRPLVFVSPDERHIAAEGRLYDAKSHELLRIFDTNLRGHPRSIFSDDGSMITTDYDGVDRISSRIFEISSGRLIRAFDNEFNAFDNHMHFYATQSGTDMESVALKQVSDDLEIGEFKLDGNGFGFYTTNDLQFVWIQNGSSAKKFSVADLRQKFQSQLKPVAIQELRMKEGEKIAGFLEDENCVILEEVNRINDFSQPSWTRTFKSVDLVSNAIIATKEFTNERGYFQPEFFADDERAIEHWSQQGKKIYRGRSLIESESRLPRLNIPTENHLYFVGQPEAKRLVVSMMATNCPPCGFYDIGQPMANGVFSIGLGSDITVKELVDQFPTETCHLGNRVLAINAMMNNDESCLLRSDTRSNSIAIPDLHCLSGDGNLLLVSGAASGPMDATVDAIAKPPRAGTNPTQMKRLPVFDTPQPGSRLVSTSDFSVKRNFGTDFNEAFLSHNGNIDALRKDKSTYVYDTRNGTLLLQLNKKPCQALSGDGRLVYVLQKDEPKWPESLNVPVEIWSLEKKSLVKLLAPSKLQSEFQTTSINGDYLFRLESLRDESSENERWANTIYKTSDWSTVLLDTLDEPVSVCWSVDERHIIWLGKRGEIRWYDTRTGKETVRLTMLNSLKSWVVTTPDLRFDASPDVKSHIHFWIKGTTDLVPRPDVPSHLFTPGLLMNVLDR